MEGGIRGFNIRGRNREVRERRRSKRRVNDGCREGRKGGNGERLKKVRK